MPKGIYERRSRLTLVEPPQEQDEFGEIVRWQSSDFDEWLSGNLTARWGGQALMWCNKLTSLVASNDYLLIKNTDAVLLAFRRPHPLTARPVVEELFCFARESEAAGPLRGRMKEWAKSAGAELC